MTISVDGLNRKFMTGAEVAQLLRTSESTVRYWKHIGKLKAIKPGRRVLYDVVDVAALIDAGSTGTAA